MPQLYNLIACLLDNFNVAIVFINFFKLPSLPTRHDRRSTHSVDMKQTGDFFLQTTKGNSIMNFFDTWTNGITIGRNFHCRTNGS